SSARCRDRVSPEIGLVHRAGRRRGRPGPPQHRQAGGGPAWTRSSAVRRVPRLLRPPGFPRPSRTAALRPSPTCLEAPFATRTSCGNQGVHQARRPAVLDDGRQGHCCTARCRTGEVECRGLQLWPQSGRAVTVPRHRRRVTGAKSPVFTAPPPCIWTSQYNRGGEFGSRGRGRHRRGLTGDLLLDRSGPAVRVAPRKPGPPLPVASCLIAGRPLGEPVEQWGPFVMCSARRAASRPRRTIGMAAQRLRAGA
uniref:Pirin_C domain-containing protein n=1 Tax=Macrostomum lignano TaxID=282301 RepID=A0A1I8FH12_9PLAT